MGCQQHELESKRERIRAAVPSTLRWLEGISSEGGPAIEGAWWNQSDLAQALGTTQQTVSANERQSGVNSFASGVALAGLAAMEGNLDLVEAALAKTDYCVVLKNALRKPRGDLMKELGFLAKRIGETVEDGLDAIQDGTIDADEHRKLLTDIRRLFKILGEIETLLEIDPNSIEEGL